jgi:hypothetical protein
MRTTTLRVLPDPAPNLPALPALKKLPLIMPFLKIPAFTAMGAMISRGLNRWNVLLDYLKPWMVFLLLLSIWFIPSAIIHRIDPTAVAPDQSQWLMIILSLITFLMITALCWWLLERQWRLMGLPPISQLVLHFNLFTLCQQLAFYFFSFALVLLAALGCLIAIC